MIFLSGCTFWQDRHWTDGIPHYTPALVMPQNGGDLDAFLYSEAGNLLNAMSPARRDVIAEFGKLSTPGRFSVVSVLIFPHSADTWKPVWVAEVSNGMLQAASEHFSKPFTESSYRFGRARIYKLFMSDDLILFGVQFGKWTFISESSFAIEEISRTFTNSAPALELDQSRISGASLVINTPHLERFLAQETAVRYRPALFGAFRGSGVAYLKVHRSSDQVHASFSGNMALEPPSARTNLIAALTTVNHQNVLDRFISQDAAAAVLMNARVEPVIPGGFIPETDADIWLAGQSSVYTRMARSVGDSFGLAAFASSGFLSVGEYAYIRMLENRNEFIDALNRLLEQELITRETEDFFVQSRYLSRLISGNLASFDTFYLRVVGDVVIISQRPGLLQKMASDRVRRRTLYFNETYLSARQSLPDQLSGFAYVQSEEFTKFVQNLLNPVQSVDAIAEQFDIGALGFRLSNDEQTLDWSIETYRIQRTVRPFDERWLISLDGTELSGPPVLANIGGSARNEIIVATEGGLVLGIAADGTQVFRVRTADDRPIGEPIVFDWYANNTRVILLGAGNKIYAWNNTGTPLPNFPIELSEPLSAPIQIADVTRNGLPEIIAATVDRRIHVLDQRGNNIPGWPQSVNASIRMRPVLETHDGRRGIFAFAENVIFGWEPNGEMRAGYPVFNNAPLRGELLFHRNHILSGTADGAIIAVGRGDYFSAEYGMIVSQPATSQDVPVIQAVQVANSGLVLRTRVESLSVNLPGDSTVTAPMLFAMADNGSIFGLSQNGRLLFTQSVGQPAMANHPPIIEDLNRDGKKEVVGLAGFGRLYAWDVQRGERFLAIPTSAIKYPVFSDINGNGRNELIAGSREGLRAWTINR